MLAASGATSGCARPVQSPPTGIDQLLIPTQSPDPADFVGTVTNRWLPLPPGRTLDYTDAFSDWTLSTTVARRAVEVAGVATTPLTTIVRDPDGAVVRRAVELFAQDASGNVWVFGARVSKGPGRSWRAGQDGAGAGLAMAAHPRVGDGYSATGSPMVTAIATVRETAGSITVPAGAYDAVMVAIDLGEEGRESIYYAEGLGPVAYSGTALDGRSYSLARSPAEAPGSPGAS